MSKHNRVLTPSSQVAPPESTEAPPLSSPTPSVPPGSLWNRVSPVDLQGTALYFNRELSWLAFNSRVLAEAESPAVPLFERFKFHAIVSSNLDEFFMVRVAGLKEQLALGATDHSADGMTADAQLGDISDRVHALCERQREDFETRLLPALEAEGIFLCEPEELADDALRELDARFRAEIFPILTPIAVDPGHPFPHLRNRGLNLGFMFDRNARAGDDASFGVVQIPGVLPRLIDVSGYARRDSAVARSSFVLVEDIIARNARLLFPSASLTGVYAFRVTRNFDLDLDEEEGDDLLLSIQQELKRRERGHAVRLEVAGAPTSLSLQKLVRSLQLDPARDVYMASTVLNIPELLDMVSKEDRRDLREDAFQPQVLSPLRDADNIFEVLRAGDVLLHHPYESFDPVVEMISEAADDPDVLAIKQTLYRAGGNSPIVKALARAAESGKQVTAVIELKARFDEASNIQWARTLEQSGVNVVYGLPGLKTHAKALLLVRREKDGLRRYVHLSTGNYNPGTARHYTDVGLLTADPKVGEDVSSLFNLLTSYSAPPRWQALVVAPLGLHEAVLGLIAREAENALRGKPAGIHACMNALVDEDVIEALYRASRAGVRVQLSVRGICCLRPGVPEISENIEVHAVVDRYLEHTRIFRFENGGERETYISSADWMPRNFHKRIELLIPIVDAKARAKLDDILSISWNDTEKTWVLKADGTYERSPKGEASLRSQARFIELVRERTRSQEQELRAKAREHLLAARTPSPLDGKLPRLSKRKSPGAHD